MRCAACDTVLNENEMKMTAPESGEYTDLCSTCYRHAFDFIDEDAVDVDYENMVQYNESSSYEEW